MYLYTCGGSREPDFHLHRRCAFRRYLTSLVWAHGFDLVSSGGGGASCGGCPADSPRAVGSAAMQEALLWRPVVKCTRCWDKSAPRSATNLATIHGVLRVPRLPPQRGNGPDGYMDKWLRAWFGVVRATYPHLHRFYGDNDQAAVIGTQRTRRRPPRRAVLVRCALSSGTTDR